MLIYFRIPAHHLAQNPCATTKLRTRPAALTFFRGGACEARCQNVSQAAAACHAAVPLPTSEERLHNAPSSGSLRTSGFSEAQSSMHSVWLGCAPGIAPTNRSFPATDLVSRRSQDCEWAGRWGDSPLRWFELMLFLDMEEDIEILNITYVHDKVNMPEPVLRCNIGLPAMFSCGW